MSLQKLPVGNAIFCSRESYNTNKIRKTSFCKGCLFSNNTKILLFVSNAHSYVPIKLCRVAGSIHLFRIKGRLNPENMKLKKNWIWDVLEIDWSDISITLNDNEINLPRSVIIPFKEKYRARKLLRKHPLLFYIMLKQGKTWFSLVPEPRNPSIAITTIERILSKDTRHDVITLNPF